jgi:hypothetical protein
MLLALAILSVAELFASVPTGNIFPSGEIPPPEEKNLQPVYGLTPVDLGLTADALATRASRQGGEYLVAGFPGLDQLDGPVLTRLSAPRSRLTEATAEKLDSMSTGNWTRLFPGDDASGPTGPSLTAARVSLETDGESRPCPRVGPARFACRKPGWAHVHRTDVRVRGNETSCIWSHPIENATTIIDFGRVAPTEDGRRIETALDDRVAGEPGDVDVEITWGDRTIDHRHRSEKGWQRVSLPEADEPQRLTVAISAERVGRRHFCFRFTD